MLVSLLAPAALAQRADIGARKLIHGVITDGADRPVVGATVELANMRGIEVASATTDGKGSFEISTTAKQGEYELLVTKSRQLNDQQITLDSTGIDIKLTVSGAPNNAAMRPEDTVSVRQLEIPDKARARLAAAQEQFDKGNLEAALNELQTALSIDATCSEAWAMRAYLKLAAYDSSGAVDDASHAIELDRANGGAYLALGAAYNSQKEFAKAEDALRRALDLRPELWQAQLEMAKTWYGKGRFVLALRQLEMLNQDFPDAHLVRANVLMSLGRQRDGAAEFRAFLREAPGDSRKQKIENILAQIEATDETSSSQPQ